MNKLLFIISLLLVILTSIASADTKYTLTAFSAELTSDCCVLITIQNNNPLPPQQQTDIDCDFYQRDENNALIGPLYSQVSHAGTLTQFKICALAGMSTIKYRVVYDDGFSPDQVHYGTIDISSCCNCPEDKSSWLSFDIEYGAEGCDTSQCKITPIVTIPPEITCYKYYAGWGNGDTDFGTSIPVGSPLPFYCVDKGATLDYAVAFMKNSTDGPEDEDCYAQAISDACDKPPYEPCTPDCFQTPFTLANRLTQRFILNTCPGCTVTVTYTWREACFMYQDMQILGIDFDQGGPCTNCDIADIYENVMVSIIGISNRQPVNFEPLVYPNCHSQWRISNGGCWGKEVLYFVTDSLGVFKEIVRWHPCDMSGCCYQSLQVCRTDSNTITITQIGTLQATFNCDGLTTTGDNNVVYDCIPACEWLGQINGVYGVVVLNQNGVFEKASLDYGELMYSLGASFKNEILTLTLKAEKNSSRAQVEIYDLNGNLVLSNEYVVSKGLNTLNIGAQNLVSGTYLYSVIVDGNKLSGDKFIITR